MTDSTLAPLQCRHCGATYPAQPVAICENCVGPLDAVYEAKRTLPSREAIEGRPPSLWRYREWLPATPADLGHRVGFTPLVEAPSLATALGVRRLWIKADAVSYPSLSFKDRVVAVALAAARAMDLDTVGCASTGNLANAVAAQAAATGLAAWIFIPEDLEVGKVVATTINGPNVVRIRGNYDDVNRLCAQVADRFGWGIVNVNLRSYYGEGSKTMAFEIAEQLGWRTPTAVVAPMAGGSLVTKLHKGFGEFRDAGLTTGPAPRVYGTQAAGCAPIVRAVEANSARVEPVVPDTIARSIAIGNPADGPAAVRVLTESGGWGAAVTDQDLVQGITLLARHTGIFTETAGGVTVAGALALAQAGRLTPDDEVVLCITGNGLKTVEAVQAEQPQLPVVAPRLREVTTLVDQAAAAA